MEQKDREAVEKLLSKLTDLQIKARFLWSQKEKGLDVEDTSDFAEDVSDLTGSFKLITDKLVKKTGSESIRKTMDRLVQCNNENPELARGYLDMIVRELRDVSKRVGIILNMDKIKNECKTMLKEKELKSSRKEDSQREMVQTQPQSKTSQMLSPMPIGLSA